MRRRVAVTGIGAVSALGIGSNVLWEGICSGKCGIGPIKTIRTERLTVNLAAEVKGFDPTEYFGARRLAALDRVSQFALVATSEAMTSAPQIRDPSRCGVILAAAMGQETLESAYHSFYGEAANRLPPFTVPRSMPSAPASQISIEYGLQGPSFAIASACASGAHAIGLAFQMIRGGILDFAITGGSDAPIQPGFMKAWEALRVLSHDQCRPFSRDRTGLVIGEGAGILVLEPWDEAVRRGCLIHAEIIGIGYSADATDLLAPDASGAAAAIRNALKDAGASPDQIQYVNAHGTGTHANDRCEVHALNAVFSDRLHGLPVSSSKSMFGHCLNAAGALEAIVTILALRESRLPPTIGFREVDPECDIDCVPNIMRRAGLEYALSNSFAFGGLNAVLAFKRAA